MQKQRLYLNAETIYKFITSDDEKLDNLIICKPNDIELLTTDQSVYEALASIENKSKVNLNKLVKLIESAAIKHFPDVTGKTRTIISHERAEEIRNKSKPVGGNQNVR